MNENPFDKEFEKVNPAVAKFAPKNKVDPTFVMLIENIRDHCKKVMELCDRLAEAANESEDNARKAADHLLDMLKRIK